MKKIIVIYHSQQFGNTKVMAEEIARGIFDAGGTTEMINTNERRVTLYDIREAGAVALGTPDYYSYPAGTIKTLFDDLYLWDKAGEIIKGKPAVLFMSHGGGGRAKQPFETFADRFFKRVKETIICRHPINDDAKKHCYELGKELVLKISNNVN
ncbi:MAG: flavodoxin domain-containing protein [Smithella sp.]